MKKWILASAVCGGLFSLSAALCWVFKKFYLQYVYLFGLTTDSLIPLLSLLAAACFAASGISALMLKRKKAKRKGLFTFASVWVGLLAFVFCFFSFLAGFAASPVTIVLASPDGEREVIVEEKSFLLAGYGTFYQKENALLLEKLCDYPADDGFRPFSGGAYTAKWRENGLTVLYLFGSGDVLKKVEIDFEKKRGIVYDEESRADDWKLD